MSANKINAEMLGKMFLAGAKNIEAKKEWINELNVFPVPDGDTGTNMSLTIMAAAKEVGNLTNPSMEALAKAISSGSLRGARGNSGVILSQIFRGFTKGIRDYDEIDITIMANAMQKAVTTAYKAVMKPKEGTILTVARGIAEKAVELVGTTEDMGEFIGELLKYGDYVLSQTPELLPVLKQAGVVDSGGQGLMVILKGAYDAYLGKEFDYSDFKTEDGRLTVSEREVQQAGEPVDIKFGYCTEFIVMVEKAYTEETELKFKAYLESIGDSIVVVSDEDIVKVHVHTNDPGLAIQRALKYGSLTRMKIDNMREEHTEKIRKEAEKQVQQKQAGSEEKERRPRKEIGFLAVSIGKGLNEIFRSLGVDSIIEGGQTMNPSTEDMLNAIDKVNADTVFILPNNKNIILAANQAKELVEDKKIIVIPTKTIPQGIAAVIQYIPDHTPEANEQRILAEIKNIKTGQITYAVRDTSLDGKEIRQGDIMGIGDHGILSVGTEKETVMLEMLEKMVDGDTELLSLYFGEEVAKEEAEALLETLEQAYPDCEFEMAEGGQPVYYYILSAE